MSRARLKSITVKGFKSYREETTLEVKPLTVLVGRNSGGKSSLVQALLLLKQTLASRDRSLPLVLSGLVDASSLRELAYGWPERVDESNPVEIGMLIHSRINFDETQQEIGALYRAQAFGFKGYPVGEIDVQTSIRMSFVEVDSFPVLNSLCVEIRPTAEAEVIEVGLRFFRGVGGVEIKATTNSHESGKEIWPMAALDHFLPLVETPLVPAAIGLQLSPLAMQLHNLWHLFSIEPLYDLRLILSGCEYLSAARDLPPQLYRSPTSRPESIGVSGELVAAMLSARRGELVHFRPLEGGDTLLTEREVIVARSLNDAVNDVFGSLGVDASISVQDLQEVAFRVLAGKATLQHVGRGITYLLPVVVFGLLLDPMRFQPTSSSQNLWGYLDRSPNIGHGFVEEPEAHLHPRLQGRLAQWFVSLARSGRNLIVETHSDHIVRRLRRLVADAEVGSEAERWLRENITIVEVSQHDGASSLAVSELTSKGSLARWPADFMDAASDEEDAIYDAALEKQPPTPSTASPYEHDLGEEPDDV